MKNCVWNISFSQKKLQNIHGLNRTCKYEYSFVCFDENIVHTGRLISMLKTHQQAWLLHDLLSVDNTLR